MPQDRSTIYAWTAPGFTYPEYINIATERDELIFSVRGPATPGGNSGPVVSFALPHAQVTSLIHSLLSSSAVAALSGLKPLVLYFENDLDRDTVLERLGMAHPGMQSIMEPPNTEPSSPADAPSAASPAQGRA